MTVVSIVPGCFGELAAIIADVADVPLDAVKHDAGLFDLCADNLELMLVVLNAEEKFCIEITDSEVEDLLNVGQLAALINRKRVLL